MPGYKSPYLSPDFPNSVVVPATANNAKELIDWMTFGLCGEIRSIKVIRHKFALKEWVVDVGSKKSARELLNYLI